MSVPNSEPTLFFPRSWAVESPELFAWLRRTALHLEASLTREGWNVWLPLGDKKERSDG